MNDIKVSIIIPAYNAENYIHKCLDKLLNQDFKLKYELIIVDDGSKDKTLEILKKYEKKYSNITLITQENSGQAVARNKSIDIAKGEYIMFVDIDDFVSEEILSTMYDKAKEKKSDLIYCDYYEYYGDNKLKYISNFYTKDDKANVVLANFAPWGKLYKSSFFKKTKLRFLEGKLFEDITIVPVLAALANNPYRIDKALYYYNCLNTSSIRKKSYSKKLEDVFDSVDITYSNFKQMGLLEKYRNEIEFIYLDSFLKGSVFRFSDFRDGLKHIRPLRKKIKNMFPNLLKNSYYKKVSFYDKLLINISYYFPPYLIFLIKKVKK